MDPLSLQSISAGLRECADRRKNLRLLEITTRDPVIAQAIHHGIAMRIAIFGASGRVGSAAAQLAAAAGHTVSLHVRSEEKATILREVGEVILGPIDDPLVLADVLRGVDAVICTLGTTNRKPNTVLSDMTLSIIEAMELADVSRLVCVSSLGCGKSFNQVSGRIMRWLIRGFGKEIWADKDRQEAHIESSQLDYLIVRPGGLTKKPAIGTWVAVDDDAAVSTSQRIPLQDVAAYCVAECKDPQWHRQAVTLLST